MSAFGLVSRSLTAASLFALLAACSTTDTKGMLGLGKTETKPVQAPAPVIEGNCPKIVLRDGTAYHNVYARGAKTMPDGSKDPQKLEYQASIAETTRQCRVTDSGMTITVQAAGRLVLGPAGAKGTVKLPIRVAVADDKKVLYSALTQFETPLPSGEPSSQFLFTKSDVAIPGGAGDFATIYIGFDEGPQPKKKK